MKIHAIAFDFLLAFCDEYAEFVDDPAEADFILTMNNAGHAGMDAVREARNLADKYGKPLCWWTIEDPNAYLGFLSQSALAHHVFTSDGGRVDAYKHDLGHDRVHWLPLAASERFHRPLPLREDATDFVFSGNWYDAQWEARRWGVETVILPLAEAGYSITCFSLDAPPYPILMNEPNRWIGPENTLSPGYYSATAEQYTFGKVVLAVNNQRTGMDGRGLTTMTSMRTFEALACGKPLLAAHSDAYEALGFIKGEHFPWLDGSEKEFNSAPYIVGLAGFMAGLVPAILEQAEAGRSFVLANHTYGHRLRAIMEAIR